MYLVNKVVFFIVSSPEHEGLKNVLLNCTEYLFKHRGVLCYGTSSVK